MGSVTLQDLTEATLEGGGVFDKMMAANKAHLQEEYAKGRIKGPEYATVYLGAMQETMKSAVAFLLERDKAKWQAELLRAQMETEVVRRAVLEKEMAKLDKDIMLADKQALLVEAQIRKLDRENELLEEQRKKLIAETGLIDQQVLNAKKENVMMDKQICKLEAEFDVLMETRQKLVAEGRLLSQKEVTERAQTDSSGVDPNSVVGRQNQIYTAQANGYLRDAEQKAAKILVDAWNVHRTTDDGISRNAQNRLQDTDVGRAVGRLISGVGG